ncbi:alpha/beta fold hydrolase [Sansalvadorimonas sp. 2012CJ34-2]|uniref:Alpha/beta fold hydrolase n=1 Tax=Parendozoicomonas callyspongiae TaxID=2942213 RepID=A0ABT0PCP3_9GAMM|nr:alpha/beta fold hydrolase [Sansalvadorimonas sp. 2012CJ34-2]MCL6269145.1 alpha/beta fold hydrolase [Sansalvadorimonas sp. 2012CJ34-2]
MNSQKITIPTPDGYYLKGELLEPEESSCRKQLVIINGATGVLQGYYRPFADFLRQQGFKVLIYDYRGIGQSQECKYHAPAPTMLHWGERDMDAVLNWVKSEYPDYRIHGVGHSIGGQLMGALPDNNRYDSFLGVASQHIYWRNWPSFSTRIKSWFFFRGILPLFHKSIGHLPAWVLGSEKLPKGVIRDWGRFGGSSAYLSDEKGQPIRSGFHNYQGRLKLCAVSDDHMFAPENCVRELGKLFTATDGDIHVLRPEHYQMSRIDHFGYFKKTMNTKAWEEAADWLAQ